MAPTDQKLELLKHVPLLEGLSSKDLVEVGQLADEIDVPDGQVLTREGAPGSEFFVIVNGSVRIEQGGKEIGTLGPGDFLGEISLIDDRPRTATATSVGPTALLVLTRGGFRTLMMDFPTIEHTVMKALVDRICQLDPAATH